MLANESPILSVDSGGTALCAVICMMGILYTASAAHKTEVFSGNGAKSCGFDSSSLQECSACVCIALLRSGAFAERGWLHEAISPAGLSSSRSSSPSQQGHHVAAAAPQLKSGRAVWRAQSCIVETPVRLELQPSKQHENDDDDKNKTKATVDAMAIAIPWAAAKTTEPTEKEYDENDEKYQANRHRISLHTCVGELRIN
jgi:hypothetical protein